MAIKFDKDGHMTDGSHRCAAGIRAGKAFVTDIVLGLEADAFYTYDLKCKSRTIGDVMKTNGEINTNCLASALSWYMAYKRRSISSNGRSWQFSPDAQQVCLELTHHPDFRESVVIGRKCKHMMGAGPLSFLHYIFAEKDKELAREFLAKLSTGENLPASHPILRIRKILQDDRIKHKAKLPIGEKLANIIKGWNLLRNGKRTCSGHSLMWRSGGSRPEEFPVAI